MRASVRCAVFFLILSLHLQAGPIVIADDFNDNVLNPALWTVAGFGPASIAEANQRLELTLTGEGGALTRLRGLVIGDFDLRFDYFLLSDIDSLDPEEAEPAVGTLWFFPDSGSFLIRSTGCIAAQLGESAGEGCYAATSALSGSLRLTRTGDVYTAYYRQGSDWSLLASSASPLTGPADIWLGGGISGDNGMRAAIDNFDLQADGFAAEVPEPASSAFVAIAVALFFLKKRPNG